MLDSLMNILTEELNKFTFINKAKKDNFFELLRVYVESEYGEIVEEIKDPNDLVHLSKIILSGVSQEEFKQFYNYVVSYEYIKLLLQLSSLSFSFSIDKYENGVSMPIDITQKLLDKLDVIENGIEQEIKDSNSIKELVSEIYLDLRYASNQDDNISLHLADYIKHGSNNNQ